MAASEHHPGCGGEVREVGGVEVYIYCTCGAIPLGSTEPA